MYNLKIRNARRTLFVNDLSFLFLGLLTELHRTFEWSPSALDFLSCVGLATVVLVGHICEKQKLGDLTDISPSSGSEWTLLSSGEGCEG